MKKVLIFLSLTSVVLMCCLLMGGCASEKSEKIALNDKDGIAAYLDGKKAGIVSGMIYEEYCETNYPNTQRLLYNSAADMIAALENGQIDAMFMDKPQALLAQAHNDSVWMPEVTLEEDNYGFAINISNAKLQKMINDTLVEMEADGSIKKLQDKWLGADDSAKVPDKIEYTGENGTLVFATDCAAPGFSEYVNGEATGYDVELARYICARNGYNIRVNVMQFASIIPAIDSGKADFGASCLSITEERKKSVLFSEPTYIGGYTILVPSSLKPESDNSFESAEDIIEFLSGKNVAVKLGSSHDKFAKEALTDSTLDYYETAGDMIEALKTNKIDGFITDKPQALMMQASDSAIWMPDVILKEDNYGFAIAFENTALQKKINEALATMTADGTLDHLKEKWFGSDESAKVLDELELTGENGTLVVATQCASAPFAYYKDNEPVGYDYDILRHYCYMNGLKIEYSIMQFGSIITSIASGKADIGANCISITEERKKSVLFSDPTYQGGFVLVTSSKNKPQGDTIDLDASLDKIGTFLDGKKVGVLTGSTYGEMCEKTYSGAEFSYFGTFANLTSALQSETIDAVISDSFHTDKVNDGISVINASLEQAECSFAFRLGNTDLQEKVNATIKKMKANGSYDEAYKKWLGSDTDAKIMPDYELTGENGTITVATDAANEPFIYLLDGEPAGFEAEILETMCRDYGYDIKYDVMSSENVISSVLSGKDDLASASVSVTDEQKESVLFSDSAYELTLKLAVRTNELTGSTSAETPSFWEQLVTSFKRTFVEENRWQMILEGLGVTILISVAAVIFGTLLGFLVCALRRSSKKLLQIIARVYIKIMQGTPLVVLLMILYYLVFGNISAIIVAVIGFSMNFAAYVSEMMRTGIDAVDNGQREAAAALGCSTAVTFFKVVLPQAARHFLPVFKGEFVSMVKMTSVVGYIAIQDLTKMSDIIRSRTYEAFFPLIATAIIYFLLSWLLTLAIDRIITLLDPKRRKRVVKGVNDDSDK